FSITGSSCVFLFCFLVASFFFRVATFLLLVASFLVASLDHFSRLFLLFKVPSFTLCFSASAFRVMFDVSHSFLIFSQFGITCSPHSIKKTTQEIAWMVGMDLLPSLVWFQSRDIPFSPGNFSAPYLPPILHT